MILKYTNGQIYMNITFWASCMWTNGILLRFS